VKFNWELPLTLEEQLERAEADSDRRVVEERTIDAREEYKRSQTELDRIGVRFLYVHEHPAFLQDALDHSVSRLVINSPWITRAVVNAEFIKKLQRLLEQRVDVYISWGLGDESEEKTDKGALGALQRLMYAYDNLRISRFGDTHAKVLLSDCRFAIVTSFNWLSFRSDPNRTFRDEQGTLVKIPELIDEKFEYFRKRFEEER
jgi:phosphatidylserine/phosphatidylglycerophosphate/cardiolipin synthase-like enzyme